MPLDAEFFRRVERLRSPVMGTELMGPLLYTLVRSTRPLRVVEAGTGYTSPFIARALADNIADAGGEAASLERKLRRWEERREKRREERREEQPENRREGRPGRADAHDDGQIHWECLMAEPTYAAPAFYCRDYCPVFHAVDTMTAVGSTARHVLDVLCELGLSHLVAVYDGDFRAFLDARARDAAPFDFIWNDAESLGGVGITELIDLVDPRGGMLVVHDTLANQGGQQIVRALREAQAAGLIELLNVVEPHKLRQNSATIVRRIAHDLPDVAPSGLTARIEQDVRRFLGRRGATAGRTERSVS
jgi:predicted O-methyltransferase YrrM